MRGFVLVVLIALGAWAAQTGVFYQTGQQWFDSCWARSNLKRDPTTPQEAIAWKQCEPVTETAVYEAGFIFGGDPQKEITPAARAIIAACPSNWSDIPIGGAFRLAVGLIEKQGGPRFVDRFIPPESLVTNAFKSQWPGCPNARVANGYPKIVRKSETWDFEVPCKPCAEEKAARASSGK